MTLATLGPGINVVKSMSLSFQHDMHHRRHHCLSRSALASAECQWAMHLGACAAKMKFVKIHVVDAVEYHKSIGGHRYWGGRHHY